MVVSDFRYWCIDWDRVDDVVDVMLASLKSVRETLCAGDLAQTFTP